MRKIYRTDENIITERTVIEPGSWIELVAPTREEVNEVAMHFDIDLVDLRAALDEEESSRVQVEPNYTLVLIDIPLEEMRNDLQAYTTIPLGIILIDDIIITVCSKENSVMNIFTRNSIKGFSTKKPMRFVYQIILKSGSVYQSYLRLIDKRRTTIEKRAIEKETENADLIDLHELESNLVYFSTSLSANMLVLERLTRFERLKQYSEDKDYLDDAMIENRQAIEMANIYRIIINGTRELISTIVNNRLNNVMKLLTSLTLVSSIPTIISGIYGMNVSGNWMPLSSTPYGFYIIVVTTVAISVSVLMILRRRKML